jgi:hypothetical protein
MRAYQSTLHTRIAEALGWTEAEVKSVSFQSLRDIVRPISQKLANELEAAIRTGSYLKEKRQ